ncbi:hypothetical protein ACJX0J_042335, partial [Zea mays]
ASKSTPEEHNKLSWKIMLESIGQYGPGYHGPSAKHEEAWKEYGCSIIEVANANMLADLWEKNMFTLLGSIVGGNWQDQGVQHLHQYGKEGFELGGDLNRLQGLFQVLYIFRTSNLIS